MTWYGVAQLTLFTVSVLSQRFGQTSINGHVFVLVLVKQIMTEFYIVFFTESPFKLWIVVIFYKKVCISEYKCLNAGEELFSNAGK